MGKRIFQVPSYTATNTADAATTLAAGTYLALAALNAASGLLVSEIYIGGQATSSSVSAMQFARHQVVGVTPATLVTPNSDGPTNSLSPATGASATAFVSATTPPQRSTAISSARLNLSLNAFGGIVRWVAYPGEEWGIVGVTVNISESSLSCSNAASSANSLVGSHIVYESYAS